MRKYIGFDIETVKVIPEGDEWSAHRPLGIACAVAYASDWSEALVWSGRDNPDGRMSVAEIQTMLGVLGTYCREGEYTLTTWNGVGFDFDIIAEESQNDRWRKGATYVAMHHVDMMFHLFCEMGYPVSLRAMAEGMGTAAQKSAEISGASAPVLWAEGRYEDVIDYCKLDAVVTTKLAEAADSKGAFEWTSRRGRRQRLTLRNGLLSVKEAMLIPQPDTSWMTDPIPRERFTGWMR